MNSHEYDNELRDVLRDMPVPRHAEDYHDVLRARLIEAPVPLATAPSRSVHRNRLRFAWVVPGIAAGVAGVLLFNNIASGPSNPRNQLAEPPVVTGSQTLLPSVVLARAQMAQQQIRDAAGILRYHEFPGGGRLDGMDVERTGTTRFKMTSKGDFRGETEESELGRPITRSVAVTNATLNETLTYSTTKDGSSGDLSKNEGPYAGARVYSSDSFVSNLRELGARDDPKVREVVFGNRPAWEMELNFGSDVQHSPDRTVLTVDQATGLPVHSVSSLRGEQWSETTVTDLEVNVGFPDDAFSTVAPPGVRVDITDRKNQRVPLDEVQSVVGYAPVVPAFVPDGYAFDAAFVAKDTGQSGDEGHNPRSTDVVQLTYRRGLEVMVVKTNRSIPNNETPQERKDRIEWGWIDPFGYEHEPEHPITKTQLSSGAFAGLKVAVVTKSTNAPHLWGVGDKLMLTVAGDLSEEELVKVAESMAVRP